MAESLIPSGTVQTLDIPSKAVQRKTGFSIDFGSSVLKIAYAQEVGDKVRLHFVSYPRDRIDEALDHIKKAVGRHISPGDQVFLTGVGGNQHKEQLEKELSIKLTLLFELDCHVSGFRFLINNCSMDELLYPPSSKVETYARTAAQGVNDSFVNVAAASGKESNILPANYTRPLPKPEERGIVPDKVEFPAVLFMLGSAGMAFIVNEDGTYESIALQPACGRTLLTTGSMMAEAKTFEELVELAEKGDDEKLNQTSAGLVDKTGSDMYAQAVDGFNVFMLGREVGKDRDAYSREDRAAAVVALAAHNLAVYCQLWSMFFKAKHVYFIGGLHTSSQLVREELGKQFAFQSLMAYNGVHTQHHFVKLSAYLGVLGALLKNLGQP